MSVIRVMRAAVEEAERKRGDCTAAFRRTEQMLAENRGGTVARDKELASFTSLGAGIGVSYEYTPARLRFLNRSTINFRYDRLRFKYDDFRDLRVRDVAPGTEPFYRLNANVFQFFVSGWF